MAISSGCQKPSCALPRSATLAHARTLATNRPWGRKRMTTDDREQHDRLGYGVVLQEGDHAGELAEDEGADDRADQALHAAEHDDHEGVDDVAGAHFGRHAFQRRDERAGEAGEPRAVGEGEAHRPGRH